MDLIFFRAAVFLTALALSALLVSGSRAIAVRFGVLDQPGHRKIHEAPMPRLGGAGVFLAFATVVVGGYLMLPWLARLAESYDALAAPVALLRGAARVEGRLAAILLGATIAFSAGLLDDLLGSRFHWGLKALGQVLAALVVVAAGINVTFLPWDWLDALVTVLWVVGITNAFNLLDNMDGLSAGVAFVASVVLLIHAGSQGEFFISLILLAFMGALLGFLLFNWEPASVFLGDCGSLFIGFTMATITLLERYVTTASSSYFPILMPVVVLALPLMDTFTVVAIRLWNGRPVYVGDRNHLSHRLVAIGLSKREAVLFIYLATFCLGVGATFLRNASLAEAILLLLQGVGIVLLLLRLMFVERE